MPSLMKSLSRKSKRMSGIFRKNNKNNNNNNNNKTHHHVKLESPASASAAANNKHDDEMPMITDEPGLTWTMSEESHIIDGEELDVDNNVLCVNNVPQFKVPTATANTSSQEEERDTTTVPPKQEKKEEEKTITFTENEVLQNQLYHMREMIQKEQELEKLKEYHRKVIEHVKQEAADQKEAELQQHYTTVIEEMKQETLAQVEQWYEKILKEQKETLSKVEMELAICKEKLRMVSEVADDRKQQLNVVSATLVQTQHDLFEEKQQSKSLVKWMRKEIETVLEV